MPVHENVGPGSIGQGDNLSQDRILFHLKTRRPQTATDVAARLHMTPAGARQHLLKPEAARLAEGENRREGRGRPWKYWRLTQPAASQTVTPIWPSTLYGPLTTFFAPVVAWTKIARASPTCRGGLRDDGQPAPEPQAN